MDKVKREMELIENELRLVMIDRMMKEKYNEIQYLAVQPPLKPGVVEINKVDLDWLLAEHERLEELKKNMDQLTEQYQSVMNSRSWRLSLRISKVARLLLKPFTFFRKSRG